MDGVLLFHRKNIEPNGDIVEMKIWQVPHSKEKPHGLKYSLVYPYYFINVDALIEDFYSDVERAKRGEL